MGSNPWHAACARRRLLQPSHPETMLHPRSLLPAVALLATGLTAQTIPTVPVQNVSQEGFSTSFIVARPGYQLTQTIYESRLVYHSVQRYSTVLLRPDGGAPVLPVPAMSRHLTLRMSTDGVPSPELASRTSFAANRGRDYTTVLNDRLVSFPAEANRPQPAPYDVTIPLDQSFPLTTYGHLLVEAETRAEASTPTQWFPDAEFYPAADWTIFTTIHGSGCPAGTVGFGGSYLSPLDEIQTVMSMARSPNGPPTHPAVAIVGTSLSNAGPIPLPAALDALGAPGCSLYTNPLQTFVGMTGGASAERFYFSHPVPRNFGLLGLQLHSQSFVFDASANALGLRASPVATFYFSSPPDPYRSLTLSSTRAGDQPMSVQPNIALVFGVR